VFYLALQLRDFIAKHVHSIVPSPTSITPSNNRHAYGRVWCHFASLGYKQPFGLRYSWCHALYFVCTCIVYSCCVYTTSLVFVSECCTHSHTAVRFSASSGGLTETGWQSFQMVFWVLLPNSKPCKSVTLECVYDQRFVSQWLAILILSCFLYTIALIKAVFWVGTITGLDYWTPRHSQDSGRGPGSSTKKVLTCYGWKFNYALGFW